MTDPVPAIPEVEATGEIAEIFADIRSVYRVSVVNLIWRHLATMPGALPWAWDALRPLYVGGLVAREASALHARLVLPDLPPIPPEVFAAASLSTADLVAIRAVLAAYDRTNAMALVALTALRTALDGAAGPPVPEAPAQGEAAIALPRLPSLAGLAAPTAALVLRLNRLGSREEAPILASMYRHLAPWPAFLALSWALLAPLDAAGTLLRAADAAVAAARECDLPVTAPPLDPAVRPQVAAALDAFAGEVIGRMVTICALLRRVSG